MASTPLLLVPNLPNDVLLSIFSFMPVADLAHCAAVCQQWHSVVSEFTYLWKGKRYVSNRSPWQSAETRAVLRALPPFPEVSVEPAYEFAMDVSYPLLVLSISDVASIEACPRLRCECLSGSLDIVGAFLSYGNTVDFLALRKLHILARVTPNVWTLPVFGVEHVVGSALETFPNLRELSVSTEFLSAHYLEALEGLGRLRSLAIECTGLQTLAFLRRCSAQLQELQLVCCAGLPSPEFAELRRLVGLRRLRLSDCAFDEGDLAAAVAALTALESLQLNRCGFVSDLSCLRQCAQLRELCVTNATAPDAVVTVRRDAAVERPWLRRLRPPAAADLHSFALLSVTISLDEVEAALAALRQLGLSAACLDYLGALRGCSRLRHLCCELVCEPDDPDLFHVRVHLDMSNPTSA